MRGRPAKLRWREPLAYHRRRYLDQYRRIGVLSSWFWIRASLPGVAVGAAFAAYIRLHHPGAWLPTWQIGVALVSVPVLILFLLYFEALFLPRDITVTPRRVNTIGRSRIRQVRIEDAPALGRMLIVDYRTDRGDEATLETPIPARIDLDRLVVTVPFDVEIVTRSEPSPPAPPP